MVRSWAGDVFSTKGITVAPQWAILSAPTGLKTIYMKARRPAATIRELIAPNKGIMCQRPAALGELRGHEYNQPG
ncbi:MAG: hypothetical protein M0T73_02490 [Deltaproteobacteria bacterium]|nr:hypothetical protein [Deltaproteobacteria bacterium]